MPLLRNSCVAAAAYSTSQVTSAILAPAWISWAAQDFCFFSWWLHTLIWKLAPPFAASLAASIWAPASAGESNGFMLLVRSTAAPMTIGACAELLPAAVAAASGRRTAAAPSASAATIPNFGFFIVPPPKKVIRQGHLTPAE